MLLVFCLTLLAGLPARWLFKAAPWPAQGVAGSVWQGQAGRIGDVGPLSWQVRPWAVQVQAGYQGQRWGLVLRGWPWDWQASVMPQGPASRVASAYRLGGGVVGATGTEWAWRAVRERAGYAGGGSAGPGGAMDAGPGARRGARGVQRRLAAIGATGGGGSAPPGAGCGGGRRYAARAGGAGGGIVSGAGRRAVAAGRRARGAVVLQLVIR